jgi:Lambda phage tail tube protein, TTP
MTYINSQATAGRASKLQYSTNPPSVAYTVLAEIKTIAFSGLKYDLADVTNMQSSNFREWLPTIADSGDLAFTGNLIPNDPTEAQLITFFNNATLVTWEVVLPPAPSQGFNTSLGTFTFLAYVSGIDRNIAFDKESTISGKLKITGPISYAAGS